CVRGHSTAPRNGQPVHRRSIRCSRIHDRVSRKDLAMSATPPRNAPISGLAVGVTLTAAIILIIGGVLHAMEGVVGLATNEFYVTTQKWIFQFDVTTWGWIHILVGLIAVLAGVGLFSGAVWARTLG